LAEEAEEMATEMASLLRLMCIKGIGPRSLSKLLDRLDQQGLSLTEFLNLEAETIVAGFGLNEEQASAIVSDDGTAAQLAQRLEENGVRTVLRSDDLYPDHLKTVLQDKTPPVLFLAGSTDVLQGLAIGFCGARDASADGLQAAESFAGAVARQKLLVVSGHAQGIDETAHRAALEAGGTTAFVLCEGILQFRPRPSIAEFMSEDRFVVISEFPPKLPWSVAGAMQRNRTICGLSQALIVIEAGTNGGTWEAGLEALRLGIPLFVIDYAEPAPSAQGNPLLLKRGGEALPFVPGNQPDLSPLLKAIESSQPRSAERLLF
jgi:DNA protecting protein DprA